MSLTISQAKSKHDIQMVKQLFHDYANWLPIDLDFQGFEEEMKTFPEKYILLLLAKEGNTPVGAVGLIPHKSGSCEMKRLFVSPNIQSKGVGRALCDRLISEAKTAGYKTMVLDTLARLKPAVALYKKLGFTEIEPYNINPEPDVTYMGKRL